MTIQQILFYLFSSLTLIAALMVVVSKSPVRAVLSLVLAFFSMAVLWLLLEAEFLAIILVLVYVGAVMVLFLFVVMMLDSEAPFLKAPFVRHWPIGVLLGCILLGTLFFWLGKSHFGLEKFAPPSPVSAEVNTIKSLAELLYTHYLLPFEIAGIILLVAMVAAIGLTFRAPKKLTQSVSKQIQVSKAERLTIVKMPAEKGESA